MRAAMPRPLPDPAAGAAAAATGVPEVVELASGAELSGATDSGFGESVTGGFGVGSDNGVGASDGLLGSIDILLMLLVSL